MKKTLLSLVFTISSLTGFAQNGIWATVNNVENLQKNQTFQSLNLKTTKAFPASKSPLLQNVYEFTIENNSNIVDVASVLNRIEGISKIEFAPVYETLSLPDDYNSAFANDYALNLINAVGAWSITTGDSTLSIGISDSNFDFAHQELFHKSLYTSTSINGTNYSHGTAVATTAAGNTNNGVGKSSIGYNTHLQFYGMTYNELLVASYNGCKVINASWASGCSYSAYGQAVIDEVYNNGSIVVAAAGNGSTCGGAGNLVYPASFNHVISVSSVGLYDNHERFMGDVNSTHQHNASVDLVAPGYDVALAIQNNAYTTGNGSSFAAPYVSGTVALMLAINPCLTYEQVDSILKITAVNINAQNPAYVGLLGTGRLNAASAVQMAANTNTITATLSLSVNCLASTPQILLSNVSTEETYTATWSNGNVGDICNATETGTYTVVIVDEFGCRFTDSIFVEKYNPITVNFNIQDVKCNGETNGKVEAVVEGGYAPYTYEWNNGLTNPMIINVAPGSYSITIKDAANCLTLATTNVNQPSPLVSQIESINNLIDLKVEGGTPEYTFEWNTGDTTEDINNAAYGFYEVLITDINGCMTSSNIILEQSVAGINEIENEINIFPNPSNGNVTIKTGKDQNNLTITNMNGQKVVIETTFNSEVSINDLSQGMYLVNINGKTQKLIIK